MNIKNLLSLLSINIPFIHGMEADNTEINAIEERLLQMHEKINTINHSNNNHVLPSCFQIMLQFKKELESLKAKISLLNPESTECIKYLNTLTEIHNTYSLFKSKTMHTINGAISNKKKNKEVTLEHKEKIEIEVYKSFTECASEILILLKNIQAIKTIQAYFNDTQQIIKMLFMITEGMYYRMMIVEMQSKMEHTEEEKAQSSELKNTILSCISTSMKLFLLFIKPPSEVEPEYNECAINGCWDICKIVRCIPEDTFNQEQKEQIKPILKWGQEAAQQQAKLTNKKKYNLDVHHFQACKNEFEIDN